MDYRDKGQHRVKKIREIEGDSEEVTGCTLEDYHQGKACRIELDEVTPSIF